MQIALKRKPYTKSIGCGFRPFTQRVQIYLFAHIFGKLAMPQATFLICDRNAAPRMSHTIGLKNMATFLGNVNVYREWCLSRGNTLPLEENVTRNGEKSDPKINLLLKASGLR